MVVAGLTLGAAGVLFTRLVWPQPHADQKPTTALTADLVRGHLRGSFPAGTAVRVVGQYPLRPTADPLAFDYHPSSGPVEPPTVRFHFDSPPPADRLARSSWIIVGVVGEFTPDSEVRVSGVRGVLSVRRATYSPP